MKRNHSFFNNCLSRQWYWLLFAPLFYSCVDTKKEQAKEELPNVVIILADDIGQGDIGYYHKKRTGKDPVIPTPNLDALIASGISFSDAHSNSALCAPTRYTVMTGNYTFRCYKQWGVWGACEKSAIGENQLTMAQLMKTAGYSTAFFGKWHLGGEWREKESEKIFTGIGTGDSTTDFSQIVGGSPNDLGFDYSFMLPSGIQNNPFAFYENTNLWPIGDDSKIVVNPSLHGGFKNRKHTRFADSNWITADAGKLLNQKAVEFIDRQTKDRPFFIYYCSQAVHVPHEPPNKFFGDKVKGETPTAHGDMIRELDLQIGNLIKKLKETGNYENTLFIFTSDNGGLNIENTEVLGHDSSNGYRGHKTYIYEGGHRVPFIGSWPIKIKGGVTSQEPIMAHDVMAALYDLTNQKMEATHAMDSYNILPLLLQEDGAKGREIIFSQGSGNRGTLAIRENGWKLILKSERNDPAIRIPIELYNLEEDLYETNNLIENPKYREKKEDLVRLYNKIRDSKERTTTLL